jgi:hypothetical protein
VTATSNQGGVSLLEHVFALRDEGLHDVPEIRSVTFASDFEVEINFCCYCEHDEDSPRKMVEAIALVLATI